MKKFTINFGGFYESVASMIIDNTIESIFQNDQGDLENELPEITNYQDIQETYCKEYLNALQDIIKDNYDLDISLKFDSLYSPSFYNFETDTIETIITEKDFKKIVRKFAYDHCVIDFINEQSKSRSGFHSFYNGIDAVRKNDVILLQYIFNYIIDENDQCGDTGSIYDVLLDYYYIEDTIFNMVEYEEIVEVV